MQKPTVHQILSPENYPYECPRCGATNPHSEDMLDVIVAIKDELEELKRTVESLSDIMHKRDPMEE